MARVVLRRTPRNSASAIRRTLWCCSTNQAETEAASHAGPQLKTKSVSGLTGKHARTREEQPDPQVSGDERLVWKDLTVAALRDKASTTVETATPAGVPDPWRG